MKKILFLMMTALAIVGCSNNEEPIVTPEPDPEQPKEYIVSFGFYGEITDISETPLTRTTTNDLYGIQVYSMPIKGTEYKPYAYGLFDDKAKMSIKLLEGYQYKFTTTMIVEGKSKIANNGLGHYEAPFRKNLENKFKLDNLESMNLLERGYSVVSSGYYNRPNCDRFYGEISNIVPEENKSISINMKRVAFGAKFIAEGLTEGKLKINIKDAPELNILYGSTQSIEDIFTFEHSGGDWTSDDYTETTSVSISWEKSDGATIPIVNQDITFKRNKLTTITVKVKDNSINNGIDINEDKTAMGQGDNIIIDLANPN